MTKGYLWGNFSTVCHIFQFSFALHFRPLFFILTEISHFLMVSEWYDCRLDWVYTLVDVLRCLLRLAKYIVNSYSSCTWMVWILRIPCCPFIHHLCLFFLTVNRSLRYLLIEFIVDGSLLERIAKRRNSLLTSYMLEES